MQTYQLAFVLESGEFEVVDEFAADGVADANRIAGELTAAEYPDRVDDWYVLCNGKNINA